MQRIIHRTVTRILMLVKTNTQVYVFSVKSPFTEKLARINEASLDGFFVWEAHFIFSKHGTGRTIGKLTRPPGRTEFQNLSLYTKYAGSCRLK